MESMRTKVEETLQNRNSTALKSTILGIIDARWKKMRTKLHSAAYLLNPRYHHDLQRIRSLPGMMRDFKIVLQKLYGPKDAAQALHEFISLYWCGPIPTNLLFVHVLWGGTARAGPHGNRVCL